MQIILKETESGALCLYDTRSNAFFARGCTRNRTSGDELCEIANGIARRSFKNIVEMANEQFYGDNGYTEYMLACDYLDLNPDIRTKVIEKIKEPKGDKRKQSKKKGRKSKNSFLDTSPLPPISLPPMESHIVTKPVATDGVKRGRGRPRKDTNSVTPPKTPVMVDGVKRGRGRPRKNPS